MQKSNYNTKWFQVSLRLQGDNLPVNEVEGRLNLVPSTVEKTGEHVRGNPKYAKYPTSLWVWKTTQDSTVPFETQIEDVLELLEPKKHELAGILSLPDVAGELFLGFSSDNGQGSAYFAPFLLARVSALGLALNLDLYPPFDGCLPLPNCALMPSLVRWYARPTC